MLAVGRSRLSAGVPSSISGGTSPACVVRSYHFLLGRQQPQPQLQQQQRQRQQHFHLLTWHHLTLRPLQQQLQPCGGGCRYMGHMVRVILRQDLPSGKSRAREVIEVAPGFARNFLIPKKIAVYATEDNLKKLVEAKQILRKRQQQQQKEDEELVIDEVEAEADATIAALLSKTPVRASVPLHNKKHNKSKAMAIKAQIVPDDFMAAARLKHYFRNKHLRIWRNVNPMSPKSIFPGMVDAAAVRAKISKQLKIELDPDETVHLSPEPISSNERDWKDMEYLQRTMEAIPSDIPCSLEIRNLACHLAKITLKGGYTVPLVVQILKR